MSSVPAAIPRWPVLVADLADQDARAFLQGIAREKGSATLPLMSAPAGTRTHVLEIFTPEHQEPLRVFAFPMGSPTTQGFPLQLFPFDPEGPPESQRLGPLTRAPAPPTVRAKSVREHRLSRSHQRELDGEATDTTPPEGLVGRKLAAGKLRIDALVGEGGMGAVYRAFHRDLRIDVAVKVLQDRLQRDVEFCRRFHAEALAASRLDHPNLMRVLDFGQEPDGLLYLAMEYVPGHALADELNIGEALPTGRIVDLMMQVCAGLQHAHARGIVHRDIKPENVLLVSVQNDDGKDIQRVKVCDFGIATEVSDAAAGLSGPHPPIVGTPEYMSPEQCSGGQLDGRSDVYACGVMLYELATGQLPFSGDTSKAIMKRQREQSPLRPRVVNPEVSPALEAIILKAMSKDPEDRHATIRDLRAALRAIREPTIAPPSSLDRTPTPAAEHEVRSSAPDWLQRGASSGAPKSRSATSEIREEEIGTSAWLARFASTEKRAEFEAMARDVEAAMPGLVETANVRVLFAIRSTIDVLAEELSRHLEWRAQAARGLQRLYGEPRVLTVLSEIALTRDAPPREVVELLIRIGTPAAYALYAVRLKQTNVTAVRRRFVNILRRIGLPAMPMIRAALLKIEAKRDVAIASALAVDLLDGSPRLRDDEAGAIVARYLESGASTSLRVVAIEALVGFWRERATPILLGFVGAEDEVSAAAVRGLSELVAIDLHVAEKIADAVRAGGSATREAVQEILGATPPMVRKILAAALDAA